MSTTSSGDEPDRAESRASEARGPFDSAEWHRRLAEARALREEALARRGKDESKARPRDNPSQPLFPSGDDRKRTAVSKPSAQAVQAEAEVPRQAEPAAASATGPELSREARGKGNGIPARWRTRSGRLGAARILAPFVLGLAVGVAIALPEPVRLLTARLGVETWPFPQGATPSAPIASSESVSGDSPNASQLASAQPVVTSDLAEVLTTSPAAAIRSPLLPRSEIPVHRGGLDSPTPMPLSGVIPRHGAAGPQKPEPARTVAPTLQVAAAGAARSGTDWPGDKSSMLRRGDLGRIPPPRARDTPPQVGGPTVPAPGPADPTMEPFTDLAAPARPAMAWPRLNRILVQRGEMGHLVAALPGDTASQRMVIEAPAAEPARSTSPDPPTTAVAGTDSGAGWPDDGVNAVQRGKAGDLPPALPRDATSRHALTEPPAVSSSRSMAPEPLVTAVAAADPGMGWPGDSESDARNRQLRGPPLAPDIDFAPRSDATVPSAPGFGAPLARAPLSVVTAARDAASAFPSGARAVRLGDLDEPPTAPHMDVAPRGNGTEPLAPRFAEPLTPAPLTIVASGPGRVWRSGHESATPRGAIAGLAPLAAGVVAPHGLSAEAPARVELRAVAPLANPADMANAGAVPRDGGGGIRLADAGDFPLAPVRETLPPVGTSAPPAPDAARLGSSPLTVVVAGTSAPGDVPSNNDAGVVSRSDLGGLPPTPAWNVPSRGIVREASATVASAAALHHPETSAFTAASAAAERRSLPRDNGGDAVRQRNSDAIPPPPASGMAAQDAATDISAPRPHQPVMPGRLAAATATAADPAWPGGGRPAQSGPGAARMDAPAPAVAPRPDTIPPGLPSAPADEAVRQPATPTSEASIYLHAPASVGPSTVQSAANHLRRVGFAVSEPMRVDFAVSQTNVRYFHEQDADAAETAAESLDAAARNFTEYAPSPRLGTIEVWIAGRPVERATAEAARRRAAIQSERPRDMREDDSGNVLLAFLARLGLQGSSESGAQAGGGSEGSGRQAAAPPGSGGGSAAESNRDRAPASGAADRSSTADRGRSSTADRDRTSAPDRDRSSTADRDRSSTADRDRSSAADRDRSSAADRGRSEADASPRASSESRSSSGASAADRSSGRNTAVGSERSRSQASRPESSRSAGRGRSQSSRSERPDRSQGRGRGRGD